jgi:hypothetical protein
MCAVGRIAPVPLASVQPLTAPEGCRLDTERINITLRMTGLGG